MIISCGEALIDCFQKPGQYSFDAIIGGSPLNVAVALANAGSDSALLTNISSDNFGQMHIKHLEDNGVSTDFVTRSAHLSGLMFVQYNEDKSAAYNFYGHDSAEINYQYTPALDAQLAAVDCLHFGSFSLVSGLTAHSFSKIIDQQKADKIISIDINVRTAIEPDLAIWLAKFNELIDKAHIIKASSEDVCLLYNLTEFTAENAQKIMQQWADDGAILPVITDAGNGAYALINNTFVHVPANPVNIIDTVGAGDCFMAFFLNYLDKNQLLSLNNLKSITAQQLASAMTRAISAASYTVEKKGAIFPKPNDL